ncbi:SMP-30/gluconolactonase/LRE family protein [Nonomuraea sp. NPDC050536]|uniref:SMP-30/gluconolactonase/LRE family protein n=1 Tax=Nonomuraea sp. NPDC050536 TaxID=3364366 RepID=UPI0037C9A7F5
MIRELHAELVDPAAAQVGEAPAWDAAHDCLVWTDITAGLVHLSDASGRWLRTYDVGVDVGAALPSAAGGWLLACQEGFRHLSEDGSCRTVLPVHPDRPDLRFNDGKCDPRGRAWAGTMAYDQTPGAATLYRLDPGPQAVPVLRGLTLANGLGWAPDGRTMWFTDSATQRVVGYAYDLDTATLGPERACVEIAAAQGMPDGLCVDDDGCVWVALWGGSAVHRYTPEGRLDTVVQLPTAQVTSCAFGGPGRATLYITSAVHQMDAAALAREPAAGGLFLAATTSTGAPATPWAGEG